MWPVTPCVFLTLSGISSLSYNFHTNNAWCLPFPIIKTKKKRFFFEKSVDEHTKPSNQMQCLSESCGGSNLLLESVCIAILKNLRLSLAPDQFICKTYKIHGNVRVTLTIQTSDIEVCHLNNLCSCSQCA